MTEDLDPCSRKNLLGPGWIRGGNSREHTQSVGSKLMLLGLLGAGRNPYVYLSRRCCFKYREKSLQGQLSVCSTFYIFLLRNTDARRS